MNDEYTVSQAQKGNIGEMDKIISKYILYCQCIAKYYYIKGSEKEDVVQEGLIGLFKAIRDYRSGLSSFDSYAKLCIKRQIITAIIKANRYKNKPLNQSVQELDTFNRTLLIDSSYNPEDVLLSKENEREFQEKLIVLSQFERQVFEEYIDNGGHGKINKKIAHHIYPGADTKSYKKVDNALQRAKKKLRKAMA